MTWFDFWTTPWVSVYDASIVSVPAATPAYVNIAMPFASVTAVSVTPRVLVHSRP